MHFNHKTSICYCKSSLAQWNQWQHSWALILNIFSARFLNCLSIRSVESRFSTFALPSITFTYQYHYSLDSNHRVATTYLFLEELACELYFQWYVSTVTSILFKQYVTCLQQWLIHNSYRFPTSLYLYRKYGKTGSYDRGCHDKWAWLTC